LHFFGKNRKCLARFQTFLLIPEKGTKIDEMAEFIYIQFIMCFFCPASPRLAWFLLIYRHLRLQRPRDHPRREP